MTNWYITQTGAGALSGVSPANAWAVGTQVWGGAGIVAGDTVHLQGTFTSVFTVLGSGSAGNPITILFDAGANFTAASGTPWPSTGAIHVDGRSFVTIDGGATGTIGGFFGNPALSNGYITNTSNGVGSTTSSATTGIWCASPNNVIVKNLVVFNLFTRSSGTDQNEFGKGVYMLWNGGSTAFGNNTVTNCIFHDQFQGLQIDYIVGCSNFTYSFCTGYNQNWGGNCGDHDSASTLTGVFVHDNYWYNFTNWDDTSGSNQHHHNGFFGWSVQAQGGLTGNLSNIQFYNNIIGPGFYVGSGTNHATSGVFVQGHVSSAQAFNNFIIFGAGDYPSDAGVYFQPYPIVTGTYLVAHNTVVGGGNGIAYFFDPDQIYNAWISGHAYVAGNTVTNTGNFYTCINPTSGTTAPPSDPTDWVLSTGAQTPTIVNNIASGVATAIAIGDNPTVTATINNNIGYNLNAAQQYSYSATSSSSFKNLATWQGLGFDNWAGSSGVVNANPTLNSNGSIGVSSTPRGNGTAVATITADITGRARPSATPAIGAYEYYQVSQSALAPGYTIVTAGP